jgi:hypothetical protein
MSSGLRVFRVPATVVQLGTQCFSHCKGLESLEFACDSHLRALPDELIDGCPLSFFHIVDSVLTISPSAFLGCSVSNVVTDGKNFQFVDGCLYAGGYAHLLFCFGRTSMLELPRDVEVIGRSCFARNLSVGFVSFSPDSKLKKIDSCAFQAANLISIVIPSSVEILGPFVFQDCSVLMSVVFERPSVLERISEGSFQHCGLPAIEIPRSVEVIDRFAFCRCSALRTVTFEPESEVTQLSESAFQECGLVVIEIPPSVVFIGRLCFYDCRNLETLVIAPEGQITRIDEGAFFKTRVESVRLPSSLRFLGEFAFSSEISVETGDLELGDWARLRMKDAAIVFSRS